MSQPQEESPQRVFALPQMSYHPQAVFLDSEPTLTSKARTTTHGRIKNDCNACAEAARHHLGTRQSRQEGLVLFGSLSAISGTFNSLFKVLFTFPHGTCFLSVSNQYLALDEIYHPLCAPIPRNVTRRRYAVHGGLQMTDGTLTLADALFQEAYICASVGNTSRDYNSRPRAPISMLS